MNVKIGPQFGGVGSGGKDEGLSFQRPHCNEQGRGRLKCVYFRA